MLIKFYGELKEACADFEAEVDNLQQALAAIKLRYGQEVSDNLLNNPYYYFLKNESDPDDLICIHEGLVTLPMRRYDTLIITPTVEGDILAAVILIVLVVAVAVGAVLLSNSDTPEFGDDPASAQLKDSALFNSPPTIKEEGGAVPLAYGESEAIGVLISGGIYSEDV